MSYTDPAGHVFTTGELVSAANVKTYWSDNIDALNKRINNTAVVATAETRANAAYGDLTTVGPTVGPLTVGAFCLAVITCRMANNTVDQFCFVGVDVSGATTTAAADGQALAFVSSTANAGERSSVVQPLTITPGSNTFKLKYRTTAGTGTFSNRELTIIGQL